MSKKKTHINNNNNDINSYFELSRQNSNIDIKVDNKNEKSIIKSNTMQQQN